MIAKLLLKGLNTAMDEKLKNSIENLPKTAGVYLFYLKNEPIYIGKAINIKDRVKNHFHGNTWWERALLRQGFAGRISFIKTDSEIEALVLEASLIKKFQPKFNSVWRDDKNYFFVAIGRNTDNVPYVFITHQPGNKIRSTKSEIRNKSKFSKLKNSKLASNFEAVGPFVEGASLKKTLKYLRRIFPYYTTAKHSDKKCTWCHLDLCPGPAPDLVEYKKNIKKLVLILQGKRKTVLFALRREMETFSYSREYENAKKVRDKILALEQVMAHASVIQNLKVKSQNSENKHWIKTEKMLKEILQVKTPISKIECYDISNIQGAQAVGSMVVFVNGQPDKSQYKKFRIHVANPGDTNLQIHPNATNTKRPYELLEQKPNDIAMLKQVLTRRLAHPEWGYPEVMLIDGGIAQLNVGINIKNKSLTNPTAVKFVRQVKNIKIISIAKGKQELLIENQKQHIPLKNLPQEIYNLIVHLDDEAHRFAITYHKKLRKKYLLT